MTEAQWRGTEICVTASGQRLRLPGDENAGVRLVRGRIVFPRNNEDARYPVRRSRHGSARRRRS